MAKRSANQNQRSRIAPPGRKLPVRTVTEGWDTMIRAILRCPSLCLRRG